MCCAFALFACLALLRLFARPRFNAAFLLFALFTPFEAVEAFVVSLSHVYCAAPVWSVSAPDMIYTRRA